MADNFVINSGDTVNVVVSASSPWVQVNVEPPATAAVVTVSGPQGPVGPSGPSYEGVAWWFDDGPPATVIGSKPGDLYMDVLNGVIYRLGD